MDTLNLLWELETYNIKLEEYKRQLKILEENVDIEDTEIDLNNLGIRYKEEIKNLEITEDLIRKLEIQLKSKEFLSSEIKDQLYKGSITDIKQLKQLDTEGIDLKEIVGNLETDILVKLERVDLIEDNLKNIESQRLNIHRDLKEKIYTNKVDIKKTEEKIDLAEKTIDKLSSRIDEKLLNLYKKIKNNKSHPIVSAKDDICDGCNMRVPSFQIQLLDEDKQVVLCESCGRILYRD